MIKYPVFIIAALLLLLSTIFYNEIITYNILDTFYVTDYLSIIFLFALAFSIFGVTYYLLHKANKPIPKISVHRHFVISVFTLLFIFISSDLVISNSQNHSLSLLKIALVFSILPMGLISIIYFVKNISTALAKS
jgi:hypothetical protein